MGSALLAAIGPLLTRFLTNSVNHVINPDVDTRPAVESETEQLIRDTIAAHQRITGKEMVLAGKEVTFRRAQESRDRTEDGILQR